MKLDNKLFVVSFIRQDNLPNEDYYYYSKEQALEHFNLFINDDSNLYKRIELLENDSIIATIKF